MIGCNSQCGTFLQINKVAQTGPGCIRQFRLDGHGFFAMGTLMITNRIQGSAVKGTWQWEAMT